MLDNTKICIVTSFNKKLFTEYGLKFIESYNLPFDLILLSENQFNVKHYTKHFKSKFIHENIFTIDPDFKEFINDDKNIIIKNNTDICDNTCNKFCFKHHQEHIQEKKCIICNNNKRNTHLGYCIECAGGVDEIVKITKKFSYKCFSVYNTWKKYKNNYDILIWIDADSKIIKDFNYKFIEQIIGDKKDFMMAYLKRHFTYSECGFLIFNLKNIYIEYYFEYIRNLYLSHKVYNLLQTHDSWIWDYARVYLEKTHNVNNIDLTDNYCKKHNILGNCDIVSFIFLKNYIYHFKGKRKELM